MSKPDIDKVNERMTDRFDRDPFNDMDDKDTVAFVEWMYAKRRKLLEAHMMDFFDTKEGAAIREKAIDWLVERHMERPEEDFDR